MEREDYSFSFKFYKIISIQILLTIVKVKSNIQGIKDRCNYLWPLWSISFFL